MSARETSREVACEVQSVTEEQLEEGNKPTGKIGPEVVSVGLNEKQGNFQ